MTEKRRVGLTYIDGIVTGPTGQATVTFLIDTGAQYSLMGLITLTGLSRGHGEALT